MVAEVAAGAGEEVQQGAQQNVPPAQPVRLSPCAMSWRQSPFLWWREHEKRFPAAAAVARRYLCIPATSVPTEHLFSTAGDVITKKRNSLKPPKAI